MTSKSAQIAFRYRTADGAGGVTRETTQRLAAVLGVGETQVIHYALRDLAKRVLPQYPADEGPLSAAQLRQIKARVPQGTKSSIRSSLIELAEI
jgi:hypothetical protein